MKKTIVLSAAILAVSAFLLSSFSRKTLPVVDAGAVLTKPAAEASEATFKDFLQQFPSEALPYSLDEKTLQTRLEQEVARQNDPENYVAPERKRLNWQYYKFLPDLKEASRFSRMPLSAEPVATFQTEQHYAVLYVSSRGFSGSFGEYAVAVFDKKGQHIATNQVGLVYPSTLGTFNIDKNLQAATTSWQVAWEKNYNKHGLEDNKITGLSVLETQSLNLTAKPKREEKLDDETAPEEVSEEAEEGTSE